MKPSQKPETRLRVSRVIRAERARVFEAWTRPELMQQWFCPQDLVVAEVEADVRVGGKYRIAMKEKEARGKVFTTFGIYKEIVPGEKLVFTWEWEEPGQAESLVTVTFFDKDGGTEVTVLHERYVDMDGENTHQHGWTSALENLEIKLLNGVQ